MIWVCEVNEHLVIFVGELCSCLFLFCFFFSLKVAATDGECQVSVNQWMPILVTQWKPWKPWDLENSTPTPWNIQESKNPGVFSRINIFNFQKSPKFGMNNGKILVIARYSNRAMHHFVRNWCSNLEYDSICSFLGYKKVDTIKMCALRYIGNFAWRFWVPPETIVFFFTPFLVP